MPPVVPWSATRLLVKLSSVSLIHQEKSGAVRRIPANPDRRAVEQLVPQTVRIGKARRRAQGG